MPTRDEMRALPFANEPYHSLRLSPLDREWCPRQMLLNRGREQKIFFGVGVCLVSIVLARIFGGALSLRAYYLGALLTGVTFAVGGTAYVVRDVSQTKGTMKVAVAYTEDRLGQSVFASLRQREKTGTFPWISRRFGPLQISTVEASRDRGVYVARVEGIPGALVAKVSPSEGELTWDNGTRQTRRATFLLATTVRTVGNRLEVNDVEGRRRNVRLGLDVQGPAQGARVVMALDRAGDTAAMIETLALPPR